jgi:hypothetical protein
MQEFSFLSDVRKVVYGTSLDGEGRLKLIRNMVLFVLGIEIEIDEYSNKRKDSIIREQAKECEVAQLNVNKWIEIAQLNRYYLSYLRRGLINFLKTGDLNYSALSFRCNPEDICLCYDVLKEQRVLDAVINKIKNENVKPVFLSDSSMKYIMKQIEYTIKISLDSVRFLTDNGVEERSFLETDLKIWAYRVMYLQDGTIDLVYLVNYLKQAVSNHCQNVRNRYTAQKRNSGLLKVNDEEGAKAEYTKISVPLTEELGQMLVAKDKVKKDGVPEFVEKINFSKFDKDRLRRFFNIINGTPDPEFENWLDYKQMRSQLENKQGNEYIDLLSALAVEFIGMSYLMPRIRDSWEVFHDCKNLPPKAYRYMKSVDAILNMAIPIKVQCRALICGLKWYPDDFIQFLKLNKKDIDELSDSEIQNQVDILYGTMSQRDLVLYRAAMNKITVKV